MWREGQVGRPHVVCAPRRRLGGNSYNFLLWLLSELRFPIAALLTVIVNAGVFSPHYPNLAVSLGLGVWFGAYFRIFRVVELLEHYAQSKADLEKRIGELTGRSILGTESTPP